MKHILISMGVFFFLLSAIPLLIGVLRKNENARLTASVFILIGGLCFGLNIVFITITAIDKFLFVGN